MDDETLRTEANALAKKILLSGERSGVYPMNLKACSALIAQLIKQDRNRRDNASRLAELRAFEPLQRTHDKCLDPRSCIGYQNAASDFDNEKEIRLTQLTTNSEVKHG